MSQSPHGGSSPKGGQLGGKASQMRAQLANKAREREEFEARSRALLLEMDSEKVKLGAIRLGLRNYEVSFIPVEDGVGAHPSSPKHDGSNPSINAAQGAGSLHLASTI